MATQAAYVNDIEAALPPLVPAYPGEDDTADLLSALAGVLRVPAVPAADAHRALLHLVDTYVLAEDDAWEPLRGLVDAALGAAGAHLRRSHALCLGADTYGYDDAAPAVDIRPGQAAWAAWSAATDGLDAEAEAELWERVSDRWWFFVTETVADEFGGHYKVSSDGRSGGQAIIEVASQRGTHMGPLCASEGTLDDVLAVVKVITDHMDGLPDLISEVRDDTGSDEWGE